MNTILLKFAFLACLIFVIEACNCSSERKKRSVVADSAITPSNTRRLRRYFARCLRNSNVGNIWDWNSVIDVMILDTSWYEGHVPGQDTSPLEAVKCSRHSDDELIRKLDTFIKNTANRNLLQAFRDCNDDYTFSPFNSPRYAVQRRSQSIGESFSPSSPSVIEYGTCINESVQLPPGRRDIDFPSIFQFVAENTVCSSQLSGCDHDYRGTNGTIIPQWPFRLQALIKPTSPLSEVIEKCNNDVFLCTDWSAWSECSVTCGGGVRRRRRSCSKRGLKTTQRKSCSKNRCPCCLLSAFPGFARRRCGSPSISKTKCLQRNCCYIRRNCYKSTCNDTPCFGGSRCSVAT